MNKHKLKVGQRVFVEHDFDRGKPTEYEISKIGRKWAEYKYPDSRFSHSQGRFDIETLHPDSRNGSVWLSLEERAAERLLLETWREFCRDIHALQNHIPSHISLTAIKAARFELGL